MKLKFITLCDPRINNGGFQALFRKKVKFFNRSKTSKPTSGASEIVKTGAIESLVALGLRYYGSTTVSEIRHFNKVEEQSSSF